MVRLAFSPSSLAATFVALGFAIGACGGDDGGTAKDASIDTPPSACGADAFFTGDFVDWNANDATFCGVFRAAATLQGDTTHKDTTRPNGRFELCVPHAALTVVDVVPSADTSQCLPHDHSADADYVYPAAAVFVAPQAIVDRDPAVFRARAMTRKTQAEVFAVIDPTNGYNAAKAQLVVHVAGTPRAVSLSANHAATQAFNGTTWAAGDVGADVFFPNVDPGSAQVTVAGGATGTGAVDLVAGKYTYVTVIAN